MRPKSLVFVALLAVLALLALVRRGEPSDPLSEAALAELLAQPLDLAPSEPVPDPLPAFSRALFDTFAEPAAPAGRVLRLGRVQADPSSARLAAEHAGELLELEAQGPDGTPGVPLWRAILDGPAVAKSADGRTLAIYGCRHSADLDAGPVLEDTYAARLALADALAAHARTQTGEAPLTLLGRELPVKGGINLEVTLVGETQALTVTLGGTPARTLRVSRTYRPEAPNDARARRALVAALRACVPAEERDAFALDGEQTPIANGVDLRLELFGDRLALTASRGKTRLATHLTLRCSDPSSEPAK